VYLFVMNLVGLAFGPSAVALTTDYVFGNDAALRYSLALVAGLALLPAVALLVAGWRPYAAAVGRET
jgi:hypothetical protein